MPLLLPPFPATLTYSMRTYHHHSIVYFVISIDIRTRRPVDDRYTGDDQSGGCSGPDAWLHCVQEAGCCVQGDVVYLVVLNLTFSSY
jgi:hypothetical protein